MNALRAVRPHLARLILAALLLAMAAGQVSDLRGFADIMATYETGVPAELLAGVLLAGEVAGGVALLTAPGRFAGGVVGLAVALAWTALASQAFARGLVVPNCGCFGVHLGQELRWWILLEDAEFILLAAWVAWSARPRARTPRAAPAPGRAIRAAE